MNQRFGALKNYQETEMNENENFMNEENLKLNMENKEKEKNMKEILKNTNNKINEIFKGNKKPKKETSSVSYFLKIE